MGQTWHDLLFAHWAVDADRLAAQMPAGLEPDRHDGVSYLGITPFRLTGLRIRGTIPLPRVSSFHELNARTYVTVGGKPGIWFFSLDAGSRIAVEGARRGFRLPYHHADMRSADRAGWIEYSSTRIEAPRPYVFEGRYRPTGAARPARPGSLEDFLVERYCLYTVDDNGALYRAEIHHPPWPLRRAQATIELNTMPPDGVSLPDEPPLLHYSERQDVLVWSLDRVA
jgi:uncharacterized protein YqjF (DUF2071 family)